MYLKTTSSNVLILHTNKHSFHDDKTTHRVLVKKKKQEMPEGIRWVCNLLLFFLFYMYLYVIYEKEQFYRCILYHFMFIFYYNLYLNRKHHQCWNLIEKHLNFISVLLTYLGVLYFYHELSLIYSNASML